MAAASTTSKSAQALRQVLQSHTAREIEEMLLSGSNSKQEKPDTISPKVVTTPNKASGVIEIASTMTPLEASKMLWENGILSAPVWDEDKGQYLGFFDMRDTLRYVLAATSGGTTTTNNTTQKSFEAILTAHWQAHNITVPALAARIPFVSCQADTSLEQVCRLMTQHDDTHSMPIVDRQSGRCVYIISQSALIKFLVQHVGDLASSSLNQETLVQVQNELPYRKDVISVPDTAPARQVFELLNAKNLSGIAVVDEETGKLVGNTSARDIKLSVLGHAAAAAVSASAESSSSGSGDDESNVISMDDMDILSYLAAIRQLTFTKKERYPSAHVAETSTVGHAVGMLAKTGYHRVFVVDSQVRPVGVVSVTDVIRFALGG